MAHRGIAAAVRTTGNGEERYAEVWQAANALALDPVLPPGAARAPRVRLYGGFSFRADHRAEGVWEAFPSGLFHLPAFELEGDGTGDAWLRARAVVPADEVEDALPRLRRRAEELRAELTTLADVPVQGPPAVEGQAHVTDRVAWAAAVDESLAAIRAGRISKAVLARTLDVTTDRPVDPVDVVAHLREVSQGSHIFFFEPEPGMAVLGAAPETVATLKDGVFHATAVAGSIRRGDSPREQAELAAQLLASDKDRAEQRIALDDMVARLETVAHQIRTDPQPHVLTLARIQHLETEIRASVPSGTGILDLLRLLHPTPAVCGLPRDGAMEFLAAAEPFERGWYAGPVGFFDVDGNGVFAPALRMGVMTPGGWRLFAGAGIVEGSVPALEWEETAIKLRPVLEALAEAGVSFTETGAPAEAPSQSPSGQGRP